ncbi:monooxygenase [Streptomyces sp. ERV7]|uniref:FAD-dependent monooxygenase n=1 Tax=Streptomyces sp. ERV7 TaxID=1322334 RepID=UPI0007F3BDBD|nr:FAD-dependent monooxygenase [Streptomyces sp. ERV7]OAR25725.1 monooxygenase [Streptomyces sp. ERV7]
MGEAGHTDGAGERSAMVVGGGIGGLAAGIALTRSGWRVKVLERAATFGEVGAGLSLWPNGLRALDALGVGDQVRRQALVETQAGIRDMSGRWLSRTDTQELDRRFGPVVMIHRARLFDILRTALPAGTLCADAKVTRVGLDGQHVEVEHGEEVSRADLLVAADGIGSSVRSALWPQAPKPRYAGYTTWRLVVDTQQRLSVGGESWGRGERVGIAPLADDRAYLFCVANAPEGQRNPGNELAEIRRRFGRWHAPIPQLLAAADEEAVLRHDIYTLPPLASFVTGRAVLLGDAAHAMTPNLGQGANQALEDAVTLAALLDAHSDVESALASYDHHRRPRTQLIGRRSDRIGVAAQWQSAPATALRDLMVRLTPGSALLNSLAPILDWQPPGRDDPLADQAG